MTEPFSPAVQSLLELFAQELSELKFPDVDGRALEGAAQSLRGAAAEVERAEAALEAARRAKLEAEELLVGKSQRALAYARVYAEDQPELLAKLDAIALPRARKPADPDAPAPRRRGRPRKPDASAPLFADEAPLAE